MWQNDKSFYFEPHEGFYISFIAENAEKMNKKRDFQSRITASAGKKNFSGKMVKSRKIHANQLPGRDPRTAPGQRFYSNLEV